MNDTIYRVQDLVGRGPWKPGFSHTWTEDRTVDEYMALQSWVDEFGLGILRHRLAGAHMGCGCRTLGQLRRWILKTEYDRLRAKGYRAVQMQIDRVLAESEVQCVFERVKPLSEDAEPVELYPE